MAKLLVFALYIHEPHVLLNQSRESLRRLGCGVLNGRTCLENQAVKPAHAFGVRKVRFQKEERNGHQHGRHPRIPKATNPVQRSHLGNGDFPKEPHVIQRLSGTHDHSADGVISNHNRQTRFLPKEHIQIP